MNLIHETIEFQRDFLVPPERVFRAFTDIREREIWSAPSDRVEVKIDRSDMRPGGVERARCGPRGNMLWDLTTYYHVIGECAVITFTEVLSERGKTLTAALVTFAFSTLPGDGARLKLTDQITSFVGAEAAAGHRIGYAQALNNLAERLAKADGSNCLF